MGTALPTGALTVIDTVSLSVAVSSSVTVSVTVWDATVKLTKGFEPVAICEELSSQT